MTPAQIATIKAYIEATPALNSKPMTPDGAYDIANELNKEKAPAYVVWKTSVNMDEIMRNGMNWARVDNLTVGKARIWDWIGRLGSFNPSKVNIRAGIDAAWVGTAADLAVRAVVYTHCKRNAKVCESLLASGTGTDVDPGLLDFEGNIRYYQVMEARG